MKKELEAMKEITPEIKRKLKKILALAETGVDGEKLLAKEKLTQLLLEYDLSLEDLQQEKREGRTFKGITTNKILMLFVNICGKVKNVSSVSYYKTKRKECIIECTEAEEKEIKNLFEWHKKNMQEEFEKLFDDFFLAYCSKHHLYPEHKNDEDSEDEEPIEIEKLMRIMSLKDNMSNKTYYKSIEK